MNKAQEIARGVFVKEILHLDIRRQELLRRHTRMVETARKLVKGEISTMEQDLFEYGKKAKAYLQGCSLLGHEDQPTPLNMRFDDHLAWQQLGNEISKLRAIQMRMNFALEDVCLVKREEMTSTPES